MKKTFLLICVLWRCILFGQADANATASDNEYLKGYNYLNGSGVTANPALALKWFAQGAAIGSMQCMNAMGNMYISGAVPLNADSAIYYYKKAAQLGYSRAYYNLGRLYQTGDFVTQNFARAAEYYKSGMASGDADCKNWVAYLYYKGLGLPQSYNVAFTLYEQLANAGDANAMYFLGKCYRNGFGTPVDKALSKKWLLKSANGGQTQALHELVAEPYPENRSVINQNFQNQLKELKAYHENFSSAATNNISGTYQGYEVYYDHSHTYVQEIVRLTLTLKASFNKLGDIEYKGTWTEGDSLTASLKAKFLDNALTFDSSSQYIRHNHYSNRSAEPYRFDKASLGIKYRGDSIYLSGDVQFYSILRKEPGQPIYIALSRKVSSSLTLDKLGLTLALSPNPVSTLLTTSFIIDKASKIRLQITDMHGKRLPLQPLDEKNSEVTLPAGSYSFPFDVRSLAAGSYVMQIISGNNSSQKIFIKL